MLEMRRAVYKKKRSESRVSENVFGYMMISVVFRCSPFPSLCHSPYNRPPALPMDPASKTWMRCGEKRPT